MDGKRDGHWVMRDSAGNVTSKGTYVDGRKHGKWIDNPPQRDELDTEFRLGFVGDGTYVEGEQQGPWFYRDVTGNTLKVEFKDGDIQLPFFWYNEVDEKCWRITQEKKKKAKKRDCLQ